MVPSLFGLGQILQARASRRLVRGRTHRRVVRGFIYDTLANRAPIPRQAGQRLCPVANTPLEDANGEATGPRRTTKGAKQDTNKDIGA